VVLRELRLAFVWQRNGASDGGTQQLSAAFDGTYALLTASPVKVEVSTRPASTLTQSNERRAIGRRATIHGHGAVRSSEGRVPIGAQGNRHVAVVAKGRFLGASPVFESVPERHKRYQRRFIPIPPETALGRCENTRKSRRSAASRGRAATHREAEGYHESS
jgi:hypothetical protein